MAYAPRTFVRIDNDNTDRVAALQEVVDRLAERTSEDGACRQARPTKVAHLDKGARQAQCHALQTRTMTPACSSEVTVGKGDMCGGAINRCAWMR